MSISASLPRQEHPVASPRQALAALQQQDGSWEGEVIWNPLITAQLAMTRAIIRRPASDAWKANARRYFEATQNKDGGWGMHPVSASYLFISVLVYVAARLLGEPEDGALATRARAWIHKQPEGPYALPSWGKLWLAFIGLYPYAGIHPVTPEFFLLPGWSPINAGRLYCHTRYIYLGLAYLYGRRFTTNLGETGRSLQRELFPAGIDTSLAIRHRHTIARTDLHQPPPRSVRMLYAWQRWMENIRLRYGIGKALHEHALDDCLGMMRNEIAATNRWCLSPIASVLYLISLYANDAADPLIEPTLDAQDTWRWEDEQLGIRYAGARSSAWDTAFAIRALLAHPAGTRADPSSVQDAIRHGYAYLAAQQCGPGPAPRNRDRQDAQGGWCFCDKRHGWPVSDCTAEAVSALLACHEVPGLIPDAVRITNGRLSDAALFMLHRQNTDGGFGTYERKSAPHFLENANPSEMFGRCMTELSYIECTASCVEALSELSRCSLEAGLASRVNQAIRKGIAFLRKAQQKDGSYPGYWGIHYIYATSFVLRGLAAAGLPRTDFTVRRAMAWLCSKQRPDGGWGEHHSSVQHGHYVENPTSLVISTSWALLGLASFAGPEDEIIRRGVAWLTEHRDASGLWPREPVNGTLCESAMLEYTFYNCVFPILALAKGSAKEHA